MQIVARASQKAGRLAAKAFAKKSLKVECQRPLVSFTFDDFPTTAWRFGGEILGKYGVNGTYYMSLGQAGNESPSGPICPLDTLPRLVADGHELGCHTYSHVQASALGSTQLAQSIEANRQALRSLLPDNEFDSFAYPYGSYNLTAKIEIGRHFRAARTIESGINTGMVDLLLLRANSMVSGRFPVEQHLRLIEENARRGGWLIFYTHDVQDASTQYGCTPAEFDEVVCQAAKRCTVVTVGEALRRLQASPAMSASP